LKIAIALLAGTLFALYLNLSPIMPQDKGFFKGFVNEETNEIEYTYYTVAEVGELDWTSLYNTYFGAATAAEGGCDKTPRRPTEIRNTRYYKDAEGETHLWWIQTQGSDDTFVFTPSDGEELITPYEMKIITQSASAAAAEGVMELKSDDTGFSIVFENLKCWYCCTTHNPDDDGVYRHKGTNSAKAGDILDQGHVLGIASAATKVTFLNSSRQEVSVAEFYHEFQNKLSS
jgi:hypothetical protein